MRYEQIEPEKWPSGIDRTAAVLGFEPDELAAACGIAFHRDLDDLDYFRYAALRLSSGRQVVLLRYERNQHPGTGIEIDARDDPTAALREVLDALDLRDTAVTWTPEDVTLPRGAAA